MNSTSTQHFAGLRLAGLRWGTSLQQVADGTLQKVLSSVTAGSWQTSGCW
jgi:hypothetical protein